ncbi:peptidylprolyl isomerase [Algibacter luteus]|uniref:peptidylprolyl isomerase n=1 Tax=Algibacter luteus TaxID=1178825 RepID=UPI002595914E|nr:peptidylprolyl isomerase [Algibacter luteus]WJJ98146.1 peptidylprolyl isomerase [Algibacter luteus]
MKLIKIELMKLKYSLTLFLACLIMQLNGQSAKNDVLFTVADEPVYTSEFLRVYNKNLDLVQDDSQKNIDEYLKLFTNYKLKLKEAKSLGLDKNASYLKELDKYKKQLAKNYITDSKVTDALVKEAYNRMSYEVNADHILVKVNENATQQDTLKAYTEILKLRDRALNEGFEKVRAEVHNGQTLFGEKLGYFTGFKMVYKFENVAFNTNVGDISEPFRTRFGYHIVNVLDKRKSRGERTVAHIMLVEKNQDSLSEKPEVKIQEIYKKLTQGESFESLAKQFSDDKNSAPNGGKLKPFSGGQIRAKAFEDVAFNLEKEGDVSEPFKTEFGWHIVKLHKITNVPSFEEMKPELVEKVKRDDRSKLIDEALINKLKLKYNIGVEPNLEYFVSILNNDYFKRTWSLPDNFNGRESLIKIGDKQFTNNDFAVYLLNTQRQRTKEAPFETLVSEKYQSFLKESLIKYQEDHLESENEDYANIVAEYRDGLLLFDLMENTIWNSSKSDSIEIERFYQKNKANYFKPERINAVVAVSTKQKTLKKVSKLLSKNMKLDQIKSLVNGNDKIDVIFTSDVMDAEHQALPEAFEFKKGVSKIYKHNDSFVVVKVNEVLPKEQKSFNEAKGKVISDYQNYKEEKWLNDLKAKYVVKVNEDVLSDIKSKQKQ